jgi:hypothetical protein
VNVGKSVVRQRLLNRLLNNVGRLAHFTVTQVGDDSVSLPLGSVPAFLGMDGLEYVAHFANFGCRNVTEGVPLKMHHAPLPVRLG